MKLVRYNPARHWNHTGSLFDRFFNDSFFYPEKNEHQAFSPRVDIISHEDDFEINVELPGVKKEKIHIDLKDNVLSIKGEKKHESELKEDRFYRKERVTGSFERRFSLSEDVMTDNIEAEFTDGVLTVKLPKNKEKTEVRQISVH